MTRCLIALGSNLGDRAATLDAAIADLAAAPGITRVQQSAWEMTIAAGVGDSQPDFLNGAALVETSLDAVQFHALLQQVETQHGRERRERWGDRTLDLDLLLFGETVIETPRLVVPHPRMSFRRFVLEPATEIAGSMMHPTIGLSLDELWKQLEMGDDRIAIMSPQAKTRGDWAALAAERLGLIHCEPTTGDTQRWPAASTAWLTFPDGRVSSGRPKLSILLDLPVEHEAGLGPLVRISPADGDRVEQDVMAAIATVWPHLGSASGQRLQ